MEDVIIIGAGMAGLTAALELKRAGRSFSILEAGDAAGGRARSRTLNSGVVADLGAHWLHGESNVLKPELDRYDIRYVPDQAASLHVFENGEMREAAMDDWLKDAIDQEKADRVTSGEAPDCALRDLGVDQVARKRLAEFGLMWDGVDAPLQPSAREFLTDENTPGGVQVDGGMCALMTKMIDDIGRDRLHLRTSVSRITQTAEGMRVQAMDGSVWMAHRVIFTGSLGVLQSRLVSFTPPLSADFHEHLGGLAMGKVNKIVVELDRQFLVERDIPVDMSMLLLDAKPPHFCHAHSAGQPVLQLYVSGNQAEAIEAFAPDEALAYVRDILAPVEALEGFADHVLSPPITTRWVANPYTRGAYSCCLPGARRSGPWTEGLITFCGDTFDDRFPASLAGAFRSGQAGAQAVIGELAGVAPEEIPA